MDEDVGCSGVDVEVVIVVAEDGQVPHPAVVPAGDPAAEDGNIAASARCAEVGAVFEGGGFDPSARMTSGAGSRTGGCRWCR